MALSTLAVAERDREAPNTAMAETRASPTIRADDVCAVRRGLRMEFSRPSRPEVPSRRASGRPMTLAMGRATAGASMATPTKMRTAPRPTSAMAGAVSPQASRATPTTTMTPPRVKRRRKGTSSSVCWADTAATGAIRTARRAGLMAATSVTPTPTTRQTMTVRASNTSGPDGSVTPNPLSSFSRPMAASTPEPQADQRRHQPHDGRLAQDGAEHLAAAGPDDAQQRQLPRALAHDDGEGVQDGEAADEERDEGEDEQRRVEEAERLADGVRRLVDHGLAGDDLDAVRAGPARCRAGPSSCPRPAGRRR